MAAAAYQSGEKLYSQFTGTWEYGRETERIDHTEILLPPMCPQAGRTARRRDRGGITVKSLLPQKGPQVSAAHPPAGILR